MAKLPVLYAPLFGGKLDTNDDEVELARLFVRKADALVEHGPDFVEYLPAKRCKTCAHYELRNEDVTAFCTEWMRPLSKRDGSGFCHNHEERT